MKTVPLIGGKFGLEQVPEFSYTGGLAWLVDDDHLCMLNARSVLWFLADALPISSIWLPSYFCPTMLQAVSGSSCRIKFFPVAENLLVGEDGWIKETGPNDMVVLIDYFGFPPQQQLTDALLEQGCHVLNDASQALLTDFSSAPEPLFLFSPRKFVGVVDGGILVSKGAPRIEVPALRSAPTDWYNLAMEAASRRAEFDLAGGGDKAWLDMSSAAEQSIPVGAYAMSDLSKGILRSVDAERIKKTRRENYKTLLDGLGDYAIYKHLPDTVVPQGFPIKLEDRNHVRRHLFSREIYPTIHWELQNFVPTEFRDSIRLASQIMTIPCDQRYTTDDMEYIISSFREIGL